jgi:tetraacyldisaccharide 4'-kinase
MHYNDHHIFSIDDWRDIKGRYESMEAKKKMVLTTEKDAMRLLKFSAEIDGMAFYVIPIEHKFLFNEEQVFLKSVEGFIENFKNPT